MHESLAHCIRAGDLTVILTMTLKTAFDLVQFAPTTLGQPAEEVSRLRHNACDVVLRVENKTCELERR